MWREKLLYLKVLTFNCIGFKSTQLVIFELDKVLVVKG